MADDDDGVTFETYRQTMTGALLGVGAIAGKDVKGSSADDAEIEAYLLKRGFLQTAELFKRNPLRACVAFLNDAKRLGVSEKDAIAHGESHAREHRRAVEEAELKEGGPQLRSSLRVERLLERLVERLPQQRGRTLRDAIAKGDGSLAAFEQAARKATEE